ncbi:hypothetical protein CHU00_02185 [Sphingobacterium cellulitidis]|uniref:DUF6602 domain-containing protein n=1 Tax=Sphingobacterium cellulitidis TaxID=1768011 RepID=UPI000B93A2BD|nr:DUF6602 domain-containing protein [Sphingobacterium cellulitidis]OYD47700.1 hypothetical protein CHU00_02185 [Sphingobacterium cellulitidis]
MANKFIIQRLEGLLATLNSNYISTIHSTSAGKGAGRANFIQLFLKECIPSNLRITTSGEITDDQGNLTGELDIVIENGFFPSWPLIGTDTTRLFIPESVAAVVEVKSNLKNQWDQVLKTGKKVSIIERRFTSGISNSDGPMIFRSGVSLPPGAATLGKIPKSRIEQKVPFFVVGYTGWESFEKITEVVNENPFISGVLQLDKGFFYSNIEYNHIYCQNSLCLYAFLECIQKAYSIIKLAETDTLRYAL